MSVVTKLKRLHKDAEALAPELPTEDMYMEFCDLVVNVIEDYIEQVKEAEG